MSFWYSTSSVHARQARAKKRAAQRPTVDRSRLAESRSRSIRRRSSSTTSTQVRHASDF
jgi:hypothetical protein